MAGGAGSGAASAAGRGSTAASTLQHWGSDPRGRKGAGTTWEPGCPFPVNSQPRVQWSSQSETNVFPKWGHFQNALILLCLLCSPASPVCGVVSTALRGWGLLKGTARALAPAPRRPPAWGAALRAENEARGRASQLPSQGSPCVALAPAVSAPSLWNAADPRCHAESSITARVLHDLDGDHGSRVPQRRPATCPSGPTGPGRKPAWNRSVLCPLSGWGSEGQVCTLTHFHTHIHLSIFTHSLPHNPHKHKISHSSIHTSTLTHTCTYLPSHLHTLMTHSSTRRLTHIHHSQTPTYSVSHTHVFLHLYIHTLTH